MIPLGGRLVYIVNLFHVNVARIVGEGFKASLGRRDRLHEYSVLS
jgi:hypothetical protein